MVKGEAPHSGQGSADVGPLDDSQPGATGGHLPLAHHRRAGRSPRGHPRPRAHHRVEGPTDGGEHGEPARPPGLRHRKPRRALRHRRRHPRQGPGAARSPCGVVRTAGHRGRSAQQRQHRPRERRARWGVYGHRRPLRRVSRRGRRVPCRSLEELRVHSRQRVGLLVVRRRGVSRVDVDGLARGAHRRGVDGQRGRQPFPHALARGGRGQRRGMASGVPAHRASPGLPARADNHRRGHLGDAVGDPVRVHVEGDGGLVVASHARGFRGRRRRGDARVPAAARALLLVRSWPVDSPVCRRRRRRRWQMGWQGQTV